MTGTPPSIPSRATTTVPLMTIRQHTTPLPSMKEIKVNVPRSFHIQLHAMRILTGKRLSDIVTEALTEYFRTTTTSFPDETANALRSVLGRDVVVTGEEPVGAPPDA